MSLETYLVKSHKQLVEIRSVFDNDQKQVEQLCTRIREIGFPRYYDFVMEHLEDIYKYIVISDSQRRQKKWLNYPDEILLRFAALQISVATVRLQDDIAQITSLVDSGSYRDFHSVMARGVCHLMTDNIPIKIWPFEQFDSPFFPLRD